MRSKRKRNISLLDEARSPIYSHTHPSQFPAQSVIVRAVDPEPLDPGVFPGLDLHPETGVYNDIGRESFFYRIQYHNFMCIAS